MIVVALLGVILASGTYFYFHAWMPIQRMKDTSWWDNASQDEMRDLCHRSIRTRLGIHHDAFLFLESKGNAESVPLLIRALKWYPPDEDGSASCITCHCLAALESLTGHDAGDTFLEWDRWWKETGSKLPAEHFHPRLPEKIKRKANKSIEATS